MVKLETTSDIRQFLLTQMEKVASGKMEPQHAKAVCNIAQQVYNTLKVEMQFAVLQAKESVVHVPPVDLISHAPTRRLRVSSTRQ